MSVTGRLLERRDSTGISGVNIRSFTDEQFSESGVTAESRPMQWGGVVIIGGLPESGVNKSRITVQKKPHPAYVPSRCRIVYVIIHAITSIR